MATNSSILATRSPWTLWRQKDMTLVGEPPRWEGVHYATGEKQRAITNSSRKNEEAGPKRKWCSIVDMSSGEGIGRRIGTWNVRSICRCSIKGHVWLFATPWTANCQTSLSFTISLSLLKLMSIELVMPSNHLILYVPLLLLPLIFPSIRVFSSESALHIRWPQYWSFNFSISPSKEYSGLITDYPSFFF